MNHQLPSHAELGPPPSLAPNTVRISYATSDDKLLAAVDRIAAALS